MHVVAIVQARMTSTRLPGKVLLEVEGKPLLAYLVERLRRARTINEICIATTVNETDDVLAEFCEEQGINCFRGSEHDVLSRYYHAAVESKADVVVRITSDCPLIDPVVVDRVVDAYLNKDEEFDYVSNSLQRTYPRGMDTEVFSFKVLEEAYNQASKPYEREHVTPYLYQHPERFRLLNVTFEECQAQHRWTVDTHEDFELVKLLLMAGLELNPIFTLEDLLDIIQRNPEWSTLNQYIEQKKLL